MFEDCEGCGTEGNDCELVTNGRCKLGLDGEAMSSILVLISTLR